MGHTRKVEYMLFPRLSALSEVLWSPKEKRNWDDFQKRLLMQFKRYDLWKTNYSKAYFDLKASVLPAENNTGVVWKLESKYPGAKIQYNKELDITDPPNPPAFQTYNAPIQIVKSGTYYGWSVENGQRLNNTIMQKFSFNKATGKKITLTAPAAEKYPGDGPFTLVNGIINEKGFARSREFLGFNGTDCEAVIDLGIIEPISFVVINSINQPSSWIWRPLKAEVLGSSDAKTWYSLKLTDDFVLQDSYREEKKTARPSGGDGSGKGMMTMSFKATYARYVKVIVTNWGTIPEGNPGAGNKPWLFVDEIEVDGPMPAELKGNN
jgi:hexosaminidase